MFIDKAFLLEEYKALREEIKFHSTHMRNIESAIIIGISAIYSFYITKYECLAKNIDACGEYYKFSLTILLIPVILSLIGFLRQIGSYARVKEIAGYIYKIEYFFLKKNLEVNGWEHYLDDIYKIKSTKDGESKCNDINFCIKQPKITESINKQNKDMLNLSHFALWIVLILTTTGFFLFHLK